MIDLPMVFGWLTNDGETVGSQHGRLALTSLIPRGSRQTMQELIPWSEMHLMKVAP